MYNHIALQGRLTADPEIRKTGSGVPVTSFTIATDAGFKDANGNNVSYFIDCVAWRKTAENICKFFEKGRLILVEGELTTRLYKDKNDKSCKATEINVDRFHFCDSKKESTQNEASDANDSPALSGGFVPCDDEDIPF